MRICRIATVPFFVFHHLGGQIAAIVRAGHEVVVVSSPGPEAAAVEAMPGIRYCAIPIARKINPLADLMALLRLYAFFRCNRFDLIHSTTPKAGLLVAIAGWLARVPVRLHTFTGQAWAERRGPVRWVGKLADTLMTRLNTRCYADSLSQREFIAAAGVALPERIAVLGQGSLAGVDTGRFNRRRRAAGGAMRAQLDIPADALVIGFVGRITRDKGIGELVAAFHRLPALGCPNAHLVLVGPSEVAGDAPVARLLAEAARHPRIHLTGYQAVPEDTMAVFDVFCLPSYREGFGNVVLEAAAMGIPSVGTRIAGLVDAIEDGATGLLVPPKDAPALAAALARLLTDEALRRRIGAAAEARALALFDAAQVNALLLREYQRLTAASGAA